MRGCRTIAEPANPFTPVARFRSAYGHCEPRLRLELAGRGVHGQNDELILPALPLRSACRAAAWRTSPGPSSTPRPRRPRRVRGFAAPDGNGLAVATLPSPRPGPRRWSPGTRGRPRPGYPRSRPSSGPPASPMREALHQLSAGEIDLVDDCALVAVREQAAVVGEGEPGNLGQLGRELDAGGPACHRDRTGGGPPWARTARRRSRRVPRASRRTGKRYIELRIITPLEPRTRRSRSLHT